MIPTFYISGDSVEIERNLIGISSQRNYGNLLVTVNLSNISRETGFNSREFKYKSQKKIYQYPKRNKLTNLGSSDGNRSPHNYCHTGNRH